MDAREERGLVIAQNSKIVKTPVGYKVPSQSGNGSYIVSYSWKFGDGQTASGSIVNHAYAKAGQYSVTLTILDYNQGTASTTIIVFISPPAPSSPPQNLPNQPMGGGKGFNPAFGGMVLLTPDPPW